MLMKMKILFPKVKLGETRGILHLLFGRKLKLEETRGILHLLFGKKLKAERDFKCVIAMFLNVRFVLIIAWL